MKKDNVKMIYRVGINDVSIRTAKKQEWILIYICRYL